MTLSQPSDSGPLVVFTCTQTSCPERFRGFTDERDLRCSVCLYDLTAIENPDQKTLDQLDAQAALTRPRAEGSAF
jgi:hypothetical protein